MPHVARPFQPAAGLLRQLKFGWLCGAIWIATAAGAQANPQAFNEGNAAYAEGDFGAAKDAYASLVEQGQFSAHLFYNLGNAWARLDEPGLAMLNYRRALALKPGHPEAAANLELLQSQAGSRVKEQTWLHYLYPDVRPDSFGIVAAAAAWGLAFAAGALIAGLSRHGWWSAAAVLSVVLLVWSLPALRWSAQADRLAMVVAEETVARHAPTVTGARAAVLPAGSEIQVLAERGEWIYAELPDETRAWIPSAEAALLRPPVS